MTYNDRILVIDDDPGILEAFRMILAGSAQEEGHIAALDVLLVGDELAPAPQRCFAVDACLQGKAGFAKVQAALAADDPYAVVFIDMRMPPGWDGGKTAQEIRRIDPMIEIIIVTAFSDASITEIVAEVGFTDRLLYLKKPFDDEEILQLADSLSMRWNLEEKVLGMVNVLEGVVDNLVALHCAFHDDRELQPLLTKMLQHISAFLATPDVFLARLENGKITLKMGLGRFANGLKNSEEFSEILHQSLSKEPPKTVFRLDDMVVLPLCYRECRNVVVGVLSERNIEGADRLLDILARNLARVFDTGARIYVLRQQIANAKRREAALQERVCQLEKGTAE